MTDRVVEKRLWQSLSDIGDGWEREAEDEHYFKEFSVKSYAIGINIIVHALAH